MENFKAIEFHKVRDFSNKMSATFEFIRQNFKGLFKSILFIAGPPVLVASLLFGSFFQDMMSFSLTGGNPAFGDNNFMMSPAFWLQMALAIMFVLISSVMGIATINNYILLYGEKQSNQIEVSEVWERVRSTFWMYLGTTILFIFVFMVVYIVLLIPMFLLANISAWLIVLGVIAVIVGLFYVMFSLSLTFFIRGYEKKSFFDSLGRSYYLVQGKWWSTFGLVFITYMIMAVASYIFMIPMYAATIVSAMHNMGAIEGGDGLQENSQWLVTGTLISFALYYLAQMFLATLPNVAIAFQYFNLVERKEAKGLMNSIDTFGQDNSATTATDEHY